MSLLKKFSLLFLLFIYPFILLGQECNSAILASTSHLYDNGNGTINDPKTGLVWKKCNEGEIWNSANNSCNGSADTFTWQNALQRAQAINNSNVGENLGKTDWRLPNIKELASIVELKCYKPSINLSLFPTTVSWMYWSSSSVANGSNYAWYVNFNYSNDSRNYKNLSFSVRLVRSGQ